MALIFLPVSGFMVMGAIAKDQGTLNGGYFTLWGTRLSLWPFIAITVIGYIDLFAQIFEDLVSEDTKPPDQGRKVEPRWDGES